MAPEHDAAARRGKFPEPSPAACGKRKLAEIAAARMLAGVAASGGASDHVGTKSLSSSVIDQRSHQSSQHELADADGTATPPPEPAVQMEENGSNLELKHMPAPPLVNPSRGNGDAIDERGRRPLGLSLQIVNPESLGVTYDQQQKRRRGADGESSPVTPWEGQLQALVSRYDP